jgi:UPF0755 protein
MKRKKILILVFSFLTLILLGLSGAKYYWDFSLLAPSQENIKKEFTIQPGEATSSIVTRLKNEGLIRNELVFRLYLRQKNYSGLIQAGQYQLSPSMTAPEIAKALTRGLMDLKVTVLEGWRVEETAAYLEKTLGIKGKDFLKEAVEGYMFPDTYRVPKSISAKELASLFRKTFDQKVDGQLKSDLTRRGLTLDEAVILASIIEREGRSDEDRPAIAGILLKRLEAGMALEVDATVQYALAYQDQEKTWWKQSLTEEDLKIDSPFNTRQKAGLPPAPIASPGLASLEAVAYPKESPYWYYLHDPQGQIHYARTLEEHNLNVANYLR